MTTTDPTILPNHLNAEVLEALAELRRKFNGQVPTLSELAYDNFFTRRDKRRITSIHNRLYERKWFEAKRDDQEYVVGLISDPYIHLQLLSKNYITDIRAIELSLDTARKGFEELGMSSMVIDSLVTAAFALAPGNEKGSETKNPLPSLSDEQFSMVVGDYISYALEYFPKEIALAVTNDPLLYAHDSEVGFVAFPDISRILHFTLYGDFDPRNVLQNSIVEGLFVRCPEIFFQHLRFPHGDGYRSERKTLFATLGLLSDEKLAEVLEAYVAKLLPDALDNIEFLVSSSRAELQDRDRYLQALSTALEQRIETILATNDWKDFRVVRTLEALTKYQKKREKWIKNNPGDESVSSLAQVDTQRLAEWCRANGVSIEDEYRFLGATAFSPDQIHATIESTQGATKFSPVAYGVIMFNDQLSQQAREALFTQENRDWILRHIRLTIESREQSQERGSGRSSMKRSYNISNADEVLLDLLGKDVLKALGFIHIHGKAADRVAREVLEFAKERASLLNGGEVKLEREARFSRGALTEFVDGVDKGIIERTDDVALVVASIRNANLIDPVSHDAISLNQL